jgi:hypothetical protein
VLWLCTSFDAAAYIDGMDTILFVCAAIAVLGAILTIAFMPGRTRTQEEAPKANLVHD